ncbi:MAG: SPASM domain-containing protein [Alphaproteobacteria bacterium]|nr:SPASM domain-containing protein [Alphaproteobacteria bacterium]
MTSQEAERDAAAMVATAERQAATGQSEAALAAFRRAIEIDPQHRAGWQGALAMLGRLGRAAEACDLADAWFRARFGDRTAIGNALFDIGTSLRDRAKLSDAARCLRHARRLAPELPSSQLPLWAHLTALAGEIGNDTTLNGALHVLADPSRADLHLPVIQLLLQRHQEAIARVGAAGDGSFAFFPLHGQIELTTYCQLRCPFCRTGGALKHDYPEIERGLMSRETFAAIMEKVPSLFYFLFYNWGEPLLHKDLLWFLEAARDLGKLTEISTNMQHLPEPLAEGIVRANLNFMRVSCDGTTQEAYEVYRSGGSLAKVLANTRRLVEWKRRLDSPFPVIIYQMVVNRFNEHQVAEYQAFAKQQGADLIHILGTSPTTPEGYLRMGELEANDPRFKRFGYGEPLSACERPWAEISFDWNGDVHLCCNPSGVADYRMGNINAQPFDEIWNGMRYRYARRFCTTQKAEDIGVNLPCHTCFRRFPTQAMADGDRWGRAVGPLAIGVG